MTRRSGPKAASPRTPTKKFDTPQGSTHRPPLGPTAEAHAAALAAAHAAIAAVGRAHRAVRLLEVVAANRCPAIRAPRHLAAQLRQLADELEEVVAA